LAAADKARKLVEVEVGSYQDHKFAIEYPQKARPDVAERATRIGWQDIPAQWIRNADHDKAEKAFFRINQGGTKIDPIERRILIARGSPTALAARAILRAGTGHNYWQNFSADAQSKIEELGREVYGLLFEPSLSLPIKTLDLPIAGQGYGPHVLPFLFDLINLTNDVPVSDSSRKRIVKEDEKFPEDPDGNRTLQYLVNTRSMIWRICSTHASSLGLHPALYFCSPSGVFQSAALLSFVVLFKSWGTDDFRRFTEVRGRLEQFLLAHRGITEAVRKLGSGSRSRPRITALYRQILADLGAGKSPQDVHEALVRAPEFSFIVQEGPLALPASGKKFARDTKGAAFLRDALPSAPKCSTCGGILHRNGMQVGHKKAKRDGGSDQLGNALIQHPFCNSTVAQ
jgi:hypothetical protein